MYYSEKVLRRRARTTGLKLALVYFLVATAWILFSDWIVIRLAASPEQLSLLQSIKGVAFVAVMSAVIGLSAARFARSDAERMAAIWSSRIDPVTELPNLRSFYETLNSTIHEARGTPVAILLVDFKEFSRINTGFGREAGDLALKRIGQLLKELAPRAHAARLEEDKFGLLVRDGGHHQELIEFANRILDCFREQIPFGEHVLPLDLNVGYALHPDDGGSVTSLLDAAELALRAAKLEGPNRARRFDRGLLESRREHFHIESELRLALEQRALSIHLQPQYELVTGKLVGAEVLARWQHPRLGSISPAVFIPVAEQAGLIDRLGEFVLNHACRCIHEWRREGLPEITLAVNVAGHQLDDQRLGFFIAQAARNWDVPLTSLEIEITESMAMHDPEAAIEALGQLREMGVSIALDDFGTGYSSLSYLLRLPVDTLKIDRTFISDLPEDQQQLSFVRTLIALGKDLGLRVVAEGIETENQHRMLQSLRCDLGQGYLLGRPMDERSFMALLHAAQQRN